jgi:uncharacterized membrane protein (DUF106 family)
VSLEIITSPPAATLLIMAISVGIAFVNSGINRLLISHFVGWDQYRIYQKETAEHRSETMKAMRANDKKQIEKLKRKDAQIKSMQAKMMKPQMLQLGISLLYFVVWIFFLTPTFQSMPVAYVPGIGTIANAHYVIDGVPGPAIPNAVPVFIWYPMCSFFFGLLSSRIIGIMPIEQ